MCERTTERKTSSFQKNLLKTFWRLHVSKIFQAKGVDRQN